MHIQKIITSNYVTYMCNTSDYLNMLEEYCAAFVWLFKHVRRIPCCFYVIK